MNFSLNISADVVAWYGAIIASVAGAKNLYDWWGDKHRLKIEWQFGMHVQGEEGDYLVITAINKGKRSIKITHVAVKTYGEKRVSILTDSFTKDEQRTLTDDKPSTQYLVKQEGVTPENLWFVIMYDARGREYRRYNPESTPFIKRCYYRVTKPKTNALVKK